MAEGSDKDLGKIIREIKAFESSIWAQGFLMFLSCTGLFGFYITILKNEDFLIQTLAATGSFVILYGTIKYFTRDRKNIKFVVYEHGIKFHTTESYVFFWTEIKNIQLLRFSTRGIPRYQLNLLFHESVRRWEKASLLTKAIYLFNKNKFEYEIAIPLTQYLYVTPQELFELLIIKMDRHTH